MEARTRHIDRDEVIARISDALVEFGADPAAMRPEARLTDIDIDSLDLFEAGQILQQEYGIAVEPEEFEGVETLGDAMAILLRGIEP